MNRFAACLCLALVACTTTRTPSGYCENDCRERWTQECLAQCGIERPKGCEESVCSVGGMSGAGAGGSGAGGSGGSGGRDSGADAGGTGGLGGAGGVVSNTGGTDGGNAEPDARVPCQTSSECEPEAPLCNAQDLCEACVNKSPCEGRPDTPRCDTRGGSLTEGHCVRCTEDAHCDDGEVCDGSACVQCRDHAGCDDPAAPQCGSDGACEPCASDEACQGRASATHCDLDAESETLGRCVECLDHGDCENPEPQCRPDRTCGGCTDNEPCEDRAETPYCNTLQDATTVGHCVACTGATEATACAGNKACKRDTGTCTERARGSVLSCGACEADSECADDLRCVENRVGGVLEGTFCFGPQNPAGCADSAGDPRRPYSQPRLLTSVDGTAAATYCLPVTTCAMLDVAASDEIVGIGELCNLTSECGDTRIDDDGFCNAQGRCTYTCTQDYECPSSGFSDCSGSGVAGSCRTP